MEKREIEVELMRMFKEIDNIEETGIESFKCKALRLITIGIHSVAHALNKINKTIEESCYDSDGGTLAENLCILAEAIDDVKSGNSISVKVGGDVDTIKG